MSRLDVRPAASDFRLLSRRATNALAGLQETHRYLRGMVQWLGFRTEEVRFTPDARRAGRSKYSLRRLVRFALDGLFSFSPTPVRAVVGGGMSLTALGWLGATAAVLAGLPIREPTTAVVLAGTAAFYLAALAILAAVGAVGEYAVRIYD